MKAITITPAERKAAQQRFGLSAYYAAMAAVSEMNRGAVCSKKPSKSRRSTEPKGTRTTSWGTFR